MTLTEQPNAAARIKLSRERVVATALDLMDREGLEAVTMRAVARELGVEAMSLYNHVKDKEDLMDGIIDAVMSEFRPPVHRDDWREATRHAGREWRRILRTHPPMIRLLADHSKPMTTASAMECVGHAIEPLLRSGLDPREAADAFHTFGGYIFGFVLMETRQTFGGPLADAVTPESVEALTPDRDLLPSLAAVLPQMCASTDEERFEFGLDLLIAGLEAKIAGKG